MNLAQLPCFWRLDRVTYGESSEVSLQSWTSFLKGSLSHVGPALSFCLGIRTGGAPCDHTALTHTRELF